MAANLFLQYLVHLLLLVIINPLHVTSADPLLQQHYVSQDQSTLPGSVEHLSEISLQFEPGASEDAETLHQFLTEYSHECHECSESLHFVKQKCNITHTMDGHLVADCSSRHIESIADLKITPPDKVCSLNLARNKISSLPRGQLGTYANLQSLTLSSNKISRLEEGSFYGLSFLKHLDLRLNLIAMTKYNFPETTFVPLMRLEELYINNNPNNVSKKHNHTLNYPDKALSVLTSLKALFIDGLPDRQFGPGFQNMSALRYLSMNGFDGPCSLHLKNNTFHHLSRLEILEMRHCNLSHDQIQSGTLKPLTSLLKLHVSNNVDLNVDGIIPLLSGNNNTLISLTAHGITQFHSRSRCVSNELAAALPRSLKFLNVESNTLEFVSDRVFDLLPPNLTMLNINNNRFYFGGYLQNLSKLENLEVLKMNGWVEGANAPTAFSSEPREHDSSCTLGKVIPSDPAVFRLPPKLYEIDLSFASLNFQIPRVQFDHNNSLRKLRINGNHIPSLYGPIHGFTKLETLDLGSNSIRHISKTFFKSFPRLKSLSLVDNDCGGSFTNNKHFLELPSTLEYLNLSNIIMDNIYLDKYNIKNLKYLILRNCKMAQFTPNLIGAKNLTFLDLTYNHIYTLEKDVMVSLSNIPNLTIDFAFNTIGCFCSNMPFLNWLYSFPRLKDRDNLQLSCDYQHAIAPISKFNLTVERLRRECASNLVLLSICTAVTAAFIFIIILVIAYRFRWRLTYWYYSLYIQMAGSTQSKTQFSQDVFISYCGIDEELVETTMDERLTGLGCRVRLKGRDFKPGTSEYLNIIESVQMCRRTLVVLSPEMLGDKWCKATVNLAGMEAQNSERSILIFLVLRPVTGKELGKDLLFQVQNSPVFYFPPEVRWNNEEEIHVFWSRLFRSCL